MPLSLAQRAMIERARVVGGAQGLVLSDSACAFLVGTMIRDLGLDAHFPEIPAQLPPFYGAGALADMALPGLECLALLERAIGLVPDADTYFACLASLHKRRLKYELILQTQPVPTVEQVGPRALLQFGKLSPGALAGFLFWRKWVYDIDNRAGQETGYLFEPIIAAAIGGVPASAAKSPVKRAAAKSQGRQVDCLLERRAYEIKLRVTIAASEQGRWREEMEFPRDCRESGFTPVMVVLDSTANPKLEELRQAFIVAGGEFYIGEAAWNHLAGLAGPTMSRFLEKYVHVPIRALLEEAPVQLPGIAMEMDAETLRVTVAGETFTVARRETAEEAEPEDELPSDVDEETPGP